MRRLRNRTVLLGSLSVTLAAVVAVSLWFVGAFSDPAPITLQTAGIFGVDGMTFSVRFPGLPSLHSYGHRDGGGPARYEWNWTSPAPNGGNREFVDISEACWFWTLIDIPKVADARLFSIPTEMSPCELDDNVGSCGYSGQAAGFDRRALIKLQISGPGFNRASIESVFASFRIES